MLELGIVALSVLGLLGLSLVVLYVPPMAVLATAGALTALGLVLGVPLGLYYHVVLRRELVRLSLLTPRWYMAPQKLHGALDEAGRGRVLPWFYAGGAGFLVIVLGLLLAVVSLVTQWR
jgi:hypothetical protein